ncbi:MAG TPA: AAA family ATPase [Rubrobacter sp.]
MARTQRKRNLRFSRLHLENWRNFVGVDIGLQERVFLIGPNASGKSNFLDVFRFLDDLVAVGGGFQEAVSRRGGVSRIRSLSARRYPEVAIHATLEGADDSPVWQYELRFVQDNRQRPIVRRERVVRGDQTLLDRPDKDDRRDHLRLTQTYLEQVNVNREYRDVVDFFRSVRYLHIVPQLVREPDRSVGKTDDPFGGDFLEQIARTPENTQRARLRRIREALEVAVPQLQDLELRRDPNSGTPHLRGKYEHWRLHGAWQNEENFSDGTLRLMGLLWAVLDGSGPLLLEEPELSLHPSVIRYIPAMFSRVQRRNRRQIIVSTHSQDLFRDPGIGLDEVFLLLPEESGTVIRPAGDFEDVKALLKGGIPLPEAIMPKTQPANVEQLALFGS